MTDVDGVRNAAGEKMATMTAAEAEGLVSDGVIKGGMVPKIRAALQALNWAGAQAVICDSTDPHALSRALNDTAFGTRITAERVAAEAPAGGARP
jgi:acetylglutamate kinase